MKKLNKVNFAPNSSALASSPPKSFSLKGVSEEKVYVREHFVAPEISMINYFLKKTDLLEKVNLPNEKNDSDDESEAKDSTRDEDYDEDDNPELQKDKRHLEHMNPNSYSWCLIRCAIVKFTIHNITSFVTSLGIDSQGWFKF